MRTDENLDFVAIHMNVYNRYKFNVVVMHYDRLQDQHIVQKCSQPLSPTAARALARAWAAAIHSEVR